LHRLIENEEFSVYSNANVDISHVAPSGTESDANYLATPFLHGRAHRNKQGHTKGVEFLLREHKKILIQLFMKGEEMKGEKRSAALMLAQLISINLLCVEFPPEVGPTTFKNDAVAVRYFARENVERFMRLKDTKGESKDQVLGLTRDGSIFETPFSRENVCGKPVPPDYIIALIWKSCCGERTGSHINNTKTLRRTGLGDDTWHIR
jgi:hypothetical protein